MLTAMWPWLGAMTDFFDVGGQTYRQTPHNSLSSSGKALGVREVTKDWRDIKKRIFSMLVMVVGAQRKSKVHDDSTMANG